MKRAAVVFTLLWCALATAAPFDCKPYLLPNGSTQGRVPLIVWNPGVGLAAFWRCANSPNLQAVVYRFDWVTPAAKVRWDQFTADPSHARMNQMLLDQTTGNWRTDPKLVEVWKPYQVQIDALK